MAWWGDAREELNSTIKDNKLSSGDEIREQYYYSSSNTRLYIFRHGTTLPENGPGGLVELKAFQGLTISVTRATIPLFRVNRQFATYSYAPYIIEGQLMIIGNMKSYVRASILGDYDQTRGHSLIGLPTFDMTLVRLNGTLVRTYSGCKITGFSHAMTIDPRPTMESYSFTAEETD